MLMPNPNPNTAESMVKNAHRTRPFWLGCKQVCCLGEKWDACFFASAVLGDRVQGWVAGFMVSAKRSGMLASLHLQREQRCYLTGVWLAQRWINDATLTLTITLTLTLTITLTITQTLTITLSLAQRWINGATQRTAARGRSLGLLVEFMVQPNAPWVRCAAVLAKQQTDVFIFHCCSGITFCLQCCDIIYSLNR
jgi:hypothetical protein